IDLEPDQFGRDLGEAVGASLCPANLDRGIATVDPTSFAQPLNESGNPWTVCQRRARAQVPDGRQLALLRARRYWPRRRTAEQRYELAPPHGAYPKAKDHGRSTAGRVEQS